MEKQKVAKRIYAFTYHLPLITVIKQRDKLVAALDPKSESAPYHVQIN